MSLSQDLIQGCSHLGETSEETRTFPDRYRNERRWRADKGIIETGGRKVAFSKHFTGVLDIIEKEEDVQGRLDLTTVALQGSHMTHQN